MYTDFFKLLREPFSIAPDPRYLFMSERHREALAHLLYGIGSGGFVLLTGEIGTGKTTICRCFLEQIPPGCKVAYIFNPKLTVIELLASICDEFGIALPQMHEEAVGLKRYVDALNAYLLSSHAEGRNNVLIIDEAQNLSADVLEQLRLLTNLETNEHKLLQILLIGQPELKTMLAKPELRQLSQRIIARYHLDPLSQHETAGYIRHRLAVAGMADGQTFQPFQPRILRRIHRLAQGIPRRINLVCDRALLGAYVEGKRAVDRRILAKAAAEVSGVGHAQAQGGNRRLRYALLGMLGIAAVGVGAWSMHAGYGLGLPAWLPKPAQTSAAAAPAASASTAPNAEKPLPSSMATPSGDARAPGSGNPPMAGLAKTSVPETGAATITPAADIEFGETQGEAFLYRRLALLWGATLPSDLSSDGAACKLLRAMELRCYQSRGGLAELRQLDRPALVTLYNDAGKAHTALLTGLSVTGATIDFGGKAQTVSLMALGHRFRGEFVTLWRAPDAFREQLRAGDRGPEVDWIAEQLARQEGAPAPEPNRLFDAGMVRRVREFQGVHGLERDGVVGPKTFMYLNRIRGVDEPHLITGTAIVSGQRGE